jgi:hypothetical protein
MKTKKVVTQNWILEMMIPEGDKKPFQTARSPSFERDRYRGRDRSWERDRDRVNIYNERERSRDKLLAHEHRHKCEYSKETGGLASDKSGHACRHYDHSQGYLSNAMRIGC